MRRARVMSVMVVLAAGVAAACSGGSATAKSTPTVSATVSPGSTSPHPLTRSELDHSLLSLADTGAGFVKGQTGIVLLRAAAALCGQQPAGGNEVSAPVWVGLQPAARNEHFLIGESLASFASSDAAQSIVAVAQHAATTCASFVSNGTRLTVRPLTIPTIGDYSFAVALSHPGIHVDLVYANIGSTVMLLSIVEDRPISSNLFHGLAGLAARHVQTAQGNPSA
jgi:hypothetical protein